MIKYKFRAEFEHHVQEFRDLTKGVTFNFVYLGGVRPYVTVEFESHLSIDEIRAEMAKIDDVRVMLQSVMPISEYTGERDTTLVTNSTKQLQEILAWLNER